MPAASAPKSRRLSGRRLLTRTTAERFTPDFPAPLTANCSALDAENRDIHGGRCPCTMS